jgi:hypothetical protein
MTSGEILSFLSSAFLVSLLLFFAIDFTGRFYAELSLEGEKVNRSFAGVYLGFVVVLFCSAFFTVGPVNSFLLPFGGLVLLSVRHLGRIRSWREWFVFKPGWFEISFILLNLLIRWVSNYDHANNSFNYDLIDSYSYSDQVFFFEKYRREATFPQMENLSLGFPYIHSTYHYAEYYVSLFFKYFLRYTNYQVLFFCAMPFLISLLQIVVFRHFRKEGFLQNLFVFLVVFTVTTLYKYFDFSIFTGLLPLDSTAVNRYHFFPVLHVSDPFSTYIYSYYGKATSFLFLVFLVFATRGVRDLSLVFFIFLLCSIVNVVFFPYLFLFFCALQLGERRFFIRCLVPVLSLFTCLAFFFILNLGTDLGIKSLFYLPRFTFRFDPVLVYKSLHDKIFFISSNFYPLLLFSALVFLIRKRTILSVSLMVLVLLFPLSFLWFEVLIKVYDLACIFLFLYLFISVKPDSTERFVAFCIVIVNLLLWNFDLYFGFIVDFFQFHQMSLVGSMFFLCSLMCFKLIRPTPAFGFLLVFFAVQNTFAINYFYHRVFHRYHSSVPFVQRFLDRTKGRMVRAVYISDRSGVPYIGYGKAGHDIKNVSDSLIQYFISPDVMTKSDTGEILRTYAWSLYQNHPFNRYLAKEGKGVPVFDAKRRFMQDHEIGCIFRLDGIPRKSMDFANPILVDSMYNEVQEYWVYFTSTGKQNR